MSVLGELDIEHRSGNVARVMQLLPQAIEELKRAKLDKAIVDTAEREGWRIEDGAGDRIDLGGEADLREAIIEFCERWDIELKETN